VQLTYVDKTTDKVGPGGTATPDRRPDGHFRLELTGSGTITSITVKTADATGKECCGQVWNTVPRDSFWILGVVENGRQLNPTDRNISIPFSGSATLDLYGSDSGYFTPGQRFLVDVGLAGGGSVTGTSAAIGPGGGGGGGGTTTTPGGGGGGGGGGTTTTATT